MNEKIGVEKERKEENQNDNKKKRITKEERQIKMNRKTRNREEEI